MKYNWNNECQQAFETIKLKLCGSKVLAYPNFKQDFILSTDASDGAIGAVLSNHDNRPVHFASRILKGAEERYSVIEKELLAIVYATKVFRPYLLGRHFVIRTDHAPLRWLYGMTNPASRLTKFRLELEPFTFTVEHIKGKDNVVADALSRIGSEDLKKLEATTKSIHAMWAEPKEQILVTTRAQAKAQSQDTLCDWPRLPKQPRRHLTIKWVDAPGTRMKVEGRIVKLTQNWETNKPELEQLMRKQPTNTVVVCLNAEQSQEHFVNLTKWIHDMGFECFVVPARQTPEESLRKEILHEAHVLPTAGHAGIIRMYNNLKRRYEWPHMFEQIAEFVNKCEQCKQMKHLQQRKTTLTLTTTSSRPFERVLLDIVGPVNIGQRMKYALTIQDDFSKYIVVAPINAKDSETVAETFVNQWVLKFGAPEAILTDCGKEFISDLFKKTCTLLGTKAVTSTPYRHETIGALENSHKSLNEYLRIFTRDKKEWYKLTPFFEFAYNSAEHKATGYAPFEVLFGHNVNIPTNLWKSNAERTMPKSYESYITKLSKTLDVIYTEVLNNVVKAKMSRNAMENRSRKDIPIKVGDKVYTTNEVRNKRDPVRTGPYMVDKVTGKNITLSNGTVVHVQKVNKLMMMFTA